MISKKLTDAVNSQINKELYSEYFYLSMSAWLLSKDFDGIANFFTVQAQEERFHAMKFFNYLLERGAEVALKQIDGPPVEFKSVTDIFEQTLEHEKLVTKSINDLMDLSIKENDHSAVSFLKWFIDEQVEEEASVSKILNQLKFTGEHPQALMMFDRQLALRKFTPEA